VGKLAGLPATVVARARGILATLEAGPSSGGAGVAGPRTARPDDAQAPQLGLFAGTAPSRVTTPVAPAAASRPEGDAVAEEALARRADILTRLAALDPDQITPRQALDILVELKKKLT